MTSNEVARYFSDAVAVGLPASPFFSLLRLRRRCGKRVHLFAPMRFVPPHLLPLVIPHKCATDRWNDILLMQLLRFAERRDDRVLTLFPCSPDAARFVDQNREMLETAYTIKNTDMQ